MFAIHSCPRLPKLNIAPVCLMVLLAMIHQLDAYPLLRAYNQLLIKAIRPPPAGLLSLVESNYGLIIMAIYWVYYKTTGQGAISSLMAAALSFVLGKLSVACAACHSVCSASARSSFKAAIGVTSRSSSSRCYRLLSLLLWVITMIVAVDCRTVALKWI